MDKKEDSIYNYEKITTEEAIYFMDRGNVRIVDVRRMEEFESGHIRGAICIPNEDIDLDEPEQLSDKKEDILVYCQSGRRSQNAALKLVRMGYENIKDFGGIEDWSYGTE